MHRLLLATEFAEANVRPLVQAALALAAVEPVEVVLVHAVSPEQAAHGLDAADRACEAVERQLLAEGVDVSGTRVMRVCSPDELLATSCRELGPSGVILAAGEDPLGAVRSVGCPSLVVGPRWRHGLPVRVEDLRSDPPLLRWRKLRELLALLGPDEACAAFVSPEGPGPFDAPWTALSSTPTAAG
ncbi:MAG: hypothetical protein R3F62_02570 [Planctomycetota bacterium]